MCFHGGRREPLRRTEGEHRSVRRPPDPRGRPPEGPSAPLADGRFLKRTLILVVLALCKIEQVSVIVEHLKAFDDEVNAFLDNMFGPRGPTSRFTRSMVRALLGAVGAQRQETRVQWRLSTSSAALGDSLSQLSCKMETRRLACLTPSLSVRTSVLFSRHSASTRSVRPRGHSELILSSWEGGYNLQCQDLTSAGEADIRVARVLWWYYFSKLIEFLDTIFFVLRKKTSQITFLHVYHHASMFNIWWCVLNWIPCGQSFFGPTLNSFIHILMYSYYGLSVFPSMHKYLWWKKYLTQAQLVQFLLTISHTMSAVVRPCGFPLGCLLFQSSYMMTLVILFLNFYIQVRFLKIGRKRGLWKGSSPARSKKRRFGKASTPVPCWRNPSPTEKHTEEGERDHCFLPTGRAVH
ncbi:hypothetical protein MJT46_017317 [Ovis ammon polii x Ovis aries]|nr:hypothetical protein MJT46_017317 [Ovis ammon polii x Ovis aries]